MVVPLSLRDVEVGGGRKLVSVHMPILDGPSLTILSS